MMKRTNAFSSAASALGVVTPSHNNMVIVFEITASISTNLTELEPLQPHLTEGDCRSIAAAAKIL